MKTKKLLVLTLVFALILTSMGVFAHSQENEATPAPTEMVDTENISKVKESAAPAQPEVQPTQSDQSVPVESNTPASTKSVPLETETSEAPAETPGSESATEIPTMEPTAEPSPDSPIETPIVEPTPSESEMPEDHSDIVIPGAETELPGPIETPTSKPFVSAYAYVRSGTGLYRDTAREEKIGELAADTVMFAREVRTYENGCLYETYFDTEETKGTASSIRAYFYASNLQRPDRAETESCIASKSSYHTVDGVKVFMAEVRYEKVDATTEPEEETEVSRVNSDSVNMRTEPDQDADRIASLKKGTPIEVLGKAANAEGETWYLVCFEAQYGYIRADLVDLVGEAAWLNPTEEPVESEAPTEDTSKPTDETTPAPTVSPEIAPTATPTVQPDETLTNDSEIPSLHTVAYFDFDGNILLAYEVEGGAILEEEIFESIQGAEPMVWYPCTADGVFTGGEPFVFGAPVNGNVFIRACRYEEQETVEAPAAIERNVNVSVARDTETLQLGSTITLTATLNGYDGVPYTCRWQYASTDQAGNVIGEWQDAQADALSISYVLTEENLLTAWRMCVTASDQTAPEQ